MAARINYSPSYSEYKARHDEYGNDTRKPIVKYRRRPPVPLPLPKANRRRPDSYTFQDTMRFWVGHEAKRKRANATVPKTNSNIAFEEDVSYKSKKDKAKGAGDIQLGTSSTQAQSGGDAWGNWIMLYLLMLLCFLLPVGLGVYKYVIPYYTKEDDCDCLDNGIFSFLYYIYVKT